MKSPDSVRLRFQTTAWRFQPDAKRLASLGYESIAHVPAVFGLGGRYLREFSRYLRDRAVLAWPPDRNPEQCFVLGKRIGYPSTATLKKFADCLINFISWLSARKYNWREISYDPHLRQYQRDMYAGRWSRDGEPLSAETIEQRIECIADFLTWACKHDYRGSFSAPRVPYERSFSTGTSSRPTRQGGSRRADRKRRHPVNLRLPDLAEIRDWLKAVKQRKGHEKALACKTILGTGIRRQELACLPVDFIPMKPAEWHVAGNNVQFLLTEGTKGGRARYVTIPLLLAKQLHAYRTNDRVKAFAKWLKNNPDAPKSDRPRQLFLSDYDGSPISAGVIYKAWTSTRIFAGWSPHLGRHTWACYELLYRLKDEAAQQGLSSDSIPVTWMEANAKT